MNIFRRTLDAEMKLACQDGLTNSTRMAKREEVTEEEEKIMWQKDLLGCQTAKSLLYTIYFYNGKLFGIRAKEHRNLRVNNFRIDSVSVTSRWSERFKIQSSSYKAYLLFRERC